MLFRCLFYLGIMNYMRIFIAFSLFTLLIPVLTWAENELISPYIHKYEANFIYEGDVKGEFKNDFVAVLDDGSQWKIHTKDYKKFSKWNIGDLVHIELQTQTEWYLFKKYYLFLFNHECNEGVEVSLLKTPLTISHSENPQPTRYIDKGFIKTYQDYRQNITASDGQQWEVIDPQLKESFPKDTPIYIGYNIYRSLPLSIFCYVLEDGKKYVSFFIINGAEQKLNWQWTRKGNYRYMWP